MYLGLRLFYMLRMITIYRYIFWEIMTPFFASMGTITFVLLISKAIDFTDLVVVKGIALGAVLKLIFFTLPYFFVFTIPMATLLGVLLAFLRLSADNEIVALKTSGVGLMQLFPPVAVIALLAWGLCTIIAMWILPWSNYKFESLIYQLASIKMDLVFKERVFLTNFSGLVIYINRLPGEGYLQDIFIVDKRDQLMTYTLIARRGFLYPVLEEKKILLRLYNGSLYSVDNEFKIAQIASFEIYDVYIEIPNQITKNRTNKHEKEMFLGEIITEMDKYAFGTKQFNLLDMELQKKFALPFSCLIMAFIGLPLGVQTNGRRSWGLAIAFLIFFSYYLMLSAAWSFGMNNFYPPRIGMWLPNLFFGFLGGLMLKYKLRDLPYFLVDFNKIKMLTNRFLKIIFKGKIYFSFREEKEKKR